MHGDIVVRGRRRVRKVQKQTLHTQRSESIPGSVFSAGPGFLPFSFSSLPTTPRSGRHSRTLTSLSPPRSALPDAASHPHASETSTAIGKMTRQLSSESQYRNRPARPKSNRRPKLTSWSIPSTPSLSNGSSQTPSNCTTLSYPLLTNTRILPSLLALGRAVVKELGSIEHLPDSLRRTQPRDFIAIRDLLLLPPTPVAPDTSRGRFDALLSTPHVKPTEIDPEMLSRGCRGDVLDILPTTAQAIRLTRNYLLAPPLPYDSWFSERAQDTQKRPSGIATDSEEAYTAFAGEVSFSTLSSPSTLVTREGSLDAFLPLPTAAAAAAASTPPTPPPTPNPAQNLPSTVAQEIRNFQKDVGMNIEGLESPFFDILVGGLRPWYSKLITRGR
ncbi:hypothetical protein C8R42DRAFT_717069 [Lentinula raphanica]|nr:hypothetical protein C8R42DRAFT_717069 [Lentinula raphanica]